MKHSVELLLLNRGIEVRGPGKTKGVEVVTSVMWELHYLKKGNVEEITEKFNVEIPGWREEFSPSRNALLRRRNNGLSRGM